MGVLMWCVISYMNPHQIGYGLSNAPLAMVIGATTIASYALSRDKGVMRSDPVMLVLLFFTVWISLTTATALHVDVALVKWEKVIKVLLMTALMYLAMQRRERIHALVWVIVASIDLYGVRGGVFTIVTGASGRVYGPPNSTISDNNQLALALIMVMPLLRYLQLQSEGRVLRIALGAAMLLTGVSIIGSFSRGALLGGVAMFAWMLMRSRHKLATLVPMVAVVVIGWLVAPAQWYDRMATIQHYDEDGSAQGRMDAWTFAFRVAVARPLVGGGFSVNEDTDLFLGLVPSAPVARAFHSIYFEVLGEHGFVGLALFLGLGIAAMLRTLRIQHMTAGDPERLWAYDLASMVQTSLIGFAVGGAFLNLAFFDLFYNLLVLVSLTWLVACQPELDRGARRFDRGSAVGRRRGRHGAPVGNSTM